MNASIIRIVALLIMGVLFSIPVTSLASENRTALVIGNSAYSKSPLYNPVNDATDVGNTLKQLGFNVILRTDISHLEMEQAVRDFGDQLRQSKGIGLFFYAGHGIQAQGRNYLLPVDVNIHDQLEVKHKSLDVDLVLGKMELAGNDVNLMILDACRNNPYERRFRGVGTGLAQMDAPSGTVIWYATRPGRVALDGDGRNSPFSHYLINTLKQDKIKAREVISQIAVAMRKEGIDQEPWQEGIWLQDFYFTQSNQLGSVESELNQTRKGIQRPVVESIVWQDDAVNEGTKEIKASKEIQVAKIDKSVIKDNNVKERKFIGEYPDITGIYSGDSIVTEVWSGGPVRTKINGEEVISKQNERGEFVIKHRSAIQQDQALADFLACEGQGKFIKKDLIKGEVQCPFRVGTGGLTTLVWKFKGKIIENGKYLELSYGGNLASTNAGGGKVFTKRKIQFLTKY